MMLRQLMIISIITSIFAGSIFAGSLTGRVNFEGKGPKKKALRMDADPVCGAAHKTPAYRESFVLSDDGYLKNVIVYLSNVKYDGEADTTQAVIDQNGCMYSPHVQGMMAGQELLIKNSDATMHNIHGLPKINPEFNFSMPKVVKEKTKIFEKVENFIKIKCDVHPWMNAYISVFDHPFFAVTDDTGSFKIENIPPGKYEVVAWHERDIKRMGYTQTKTIEVVKGGSVLDFSLTKGEKKK